MLEINILYMFLIDVVFGQLIADQSAGIEVGDQKGYD